MSDAAATTGLANASCDGAATALTPDAVEAILGDFRTWLLDTGPSAQPRSSESPEPTVDLFTLVGQFTALRHEVNMQTRAARAAVEQNAELVKELKPAERAASNDDLRPIARGLIDIADALSMS